MSLEELEKIQAIITGTAERVMAGLRGYIAAGARHVVVRLGALDLRSQRDQPRCPDPALRGANARPSPSDANSGPSANLPGTPADPAAHTLSGRGQSAARMGSDRIRNRPRAIDTIAPVFSSSATAGRFAARRAACRSGVRRSADRSRTTEGRAAPGDAASSSPKSESAEMITSSFGGIREDRFVSGGDEAYVSNVDSVESRAAQPG
jgi:hypothetical protein